MTQRYSTTQGTPAWLYSIRTLAVQQKLRYWLMLVLFSLISLLTLAQNAIVGDGFAPGWGGACGTNTDFQYLSAGAGSSWIRTTKANGTGNQFFRLGVDWDGNRRQHTLTPGSDVKAEPGTEYTLNATCTTNGAMFIEVANADDNYIFKTFNAGVNPAYRFIYFRVAGEVRTITNVSVPTNIMASLPATITATLSGPLAAGQGVYLRYSTDAFASSTVVPMAGSGTTYTAPIPGFAQGAQVFYYCFTSGSGLTIGHGTADFYTINANNNDNLNYTYTVQAATAIGTIANGAWSSPATWENGVVPNGTDAIAAIRHTVDLDVANVNARIVGVEAAGTLNMGSNTITMSNNGIFSSSGTFNAGTGTLAFAGAGLVGTALNFYNVSIAGNVSLAASTIQNQLEIKSGGTVALAGQPVYAPGSTLFINTGGDRSSAQEWTPTLTPHHVVIGANTTYTLCNAAATAAFSTQGNITVQTGGIFLLDPLCNGNTGAVAGPLQTVNLLTVGGNLQTQTVGTFRILNGDAGSLQAGTRFNVTINGNVENAGIFILNDHIGDDLFVKGNWTNTGSFSPGTNASGGSNVITDGDGRAVFFNGTTQQSISGNVSTFHYLFIDNPQGVLLNTNIAVTRTLGLSNGKVNINNRVLIVGSLYKPGAGDHVLGRITGASAERYVYGGPLVRFVTNKTQPTGEEEQVAPNLNEPYLFPVGTATEYRPFTVTYTAYPTAFGTLAINHNGQAGGTTGSLNPLTDADGVETTLLFENASWDMTGGLGLESGNTGTYNVSYTCTNCNVGASNAAQIKPLRTLQAGGSWNYPSAPVPGNLVATTGTNASPVLGRLNVVSYGSYGIGLNDAVLPVRLQSFAGVRTPHGNQLTWTSTLEENFSHYNLQRSGNGIEWSTIARIQGRGGRFTQHYQHMDNAAPGTQSYRLEMNDADGSRRYSKVVTIQGNAPLQGAHTMQYLSGARQLLLQHSTGGYAPGTQLQVMDMNGRILSRHALAQQPIQHISMQHCAAGIYLITIAEPGGKQSTEKVAVW